MPYPAKTIANFFLEKARQEHLGLTPMKLAKLIYVAHGWSLALNDVPLIDEAVQAWKFGPVIESVYHEFKHFGNDVINSLAIDFLVDPNTGEVLTMPFQVQPDDKHTIALLERVWNVYKKYTGIQLSNWSHLPGSPWYRAWYEQRGFEKPGQVIDDAVIKDYFAQLGMENG